MRITAALAALLLCATAAGAQQKTPRDAVNDQLAAAAAVKVRQGFREDPGPLGRSRQFGLMTRGGTVFLEVPLAAGREYFVSAGCDTDCTDLDLRVLAPNATTVVTENVADDDVPTVGLRTRLAGRYLLQVTMPSCSTETCWFGALVMSRPAAPARR